jgi:hypothetical protein
MKMKKKTLKKLKKAVKQLGKTNNPAWASALSAALSAFATALGGKGERARHAAQDAKEQFRPRAESPREGQMPNGMAMKDQPGPV